MIRDWTGTPKTYLPTYDMNGNMVGLLNESGGWDAWYAYDSFGNILKEGGSYAASNPFGFSTQYTDRETGLVNYGFRFYHPELGRFVNRDPIAEVGGANLYRFVGNNPVSKVDKWGLNEEDDEEEDDCFSSGGEWFGKSCVYPGEVAVLKLGDGTYAVIFVGRNDERMVLDTGDGTLTRQFTNEDGGTTSQEVNDSTDLSAFSGLGNSYSGNETFSDDGYGLNSDTDVVIPLFVTN